MRSLVSVEAGARPGKTAARQAAKTLQDLAEALTAAAEALQTPPLAVEVERGINLRAELRRFEIELIQRALNATGGRQRQAARLLGLKGTTLNAKIRRYKISTQPACGIFER